MKIPHFPTYTQVTKLLAIIPRFAGDEIRNVMAVIKSLQGTPQNPVRWDNPDEWILDRLTGHAATVAAKIWTESNRLINPRYLKHVFGMASKSNLVSEDVDGKFKLTEAGQDFLANPKGASWQKIDREEGLAEVLDIVNTHGPAWIGELMEDWVAYCHAKSNLRGEKVTRSFLRARLNNLIERRLVKREDVNYVITPDGEAYLSLLKKDSSDEDYLVQLNKTVKVVREKQKEALREKLHNMDPYSFEKLIRDLLEAMGYEDVEVTAPSGDKGVDVIGTVQVGITSVTEVVQVKRHKGNINRPVLDSLRGSLHRFNAFRGTIITLSDFAKGAREAALEKGAAPLTLINGEKLMD